MHVTVLGGGYVGIVASVCFCEFGFSVGVVEINKQRLADLDKDITSAFEPGLSPALKKHKSRNSIQFLDKLSDFYGQTDCIVIAVATVGQNGQDSDLTDLHRVINEIALNLKRDRYMPIIVKTSVPVGTCRLILNNLQFMRPDLISGEHYDIIANPSFLREGSAIHDFMSPDRVVIGLENDSKKARDFITKLYKSLICSRIPFIYTNFETAELIRYATVGFVVAKIVFMNEIADLCDRSGADIEMLTKGVGLDSRIGHKLLKSTPGFGGASYPRTARILLDTANRLGVDMQILKSALESNKNRISEISRRIINKIDDGSEISNKKVAILGLSFKAQTSDIRESPSVFVIKDLLDKGIEVDVYDPLFKTNSIELRKIPDDIISNKKFKVTDSVYDAVNQSDIAVVMTDWMEFMELDLKKVSELMNKKKNEKPIILDYRNMFLLPDMEDFEYIAQGYH